MVVEALLADSVGPALLVVPDTLAPLERFAFVPQQLPVWALLVHCRATCALAEPLGQTHALASAQPVGHRTVSDVEHDH